MTVLLLPQSPLKRDISDAYYGRSFPRHRQKMLPWHPAVLRSMLDGLAEMSRRSCDKLTHASAKTR
jgi:hypothetical protein